MSPAFHKSVIANKSSKYLLTIMLTRHNTLEVLSWFPNLHFLMLIALLYNIIVWV